MKLDSQTSFAALMQNVVIIPWGRHLVNRKSAIKTLRNIREKISNFLETGRKLTSRLIRFNEPIKIHLTAMLEIIENASFISTDKSS
jgi:hypothetical protein